MKNIRFVILFVFILKINISNAQDSIPCFTDKHMQELYKNFVESKNTYHLTDSIVFDFEADSIKIEKFYTWAKIDGYTAVICSPIQCGTGPKKDVKRLRISKKIDFSNFNIFSKELKKIDSKKEDYDIDCGSFMMR